MKFHLVARFIGLSGMLVAMLALGTLTAAADGSQLTITRNADLALFSDGVNGVIVQTTDKCSGTGAVTVTVAQSAQQSNSGVEASGSANSPVKCDGRTHKVAVSVVGTGTFNLGKATATATLTGVSGTARTTRTITITS